MAKPKSPLLSLGARGTIGDALTYQRRGREHIVRQKPIPKDPYSLAQAYQRWDYRDYAYLWTLLSNSEKQIYRTKASRYHITGFSQFMRENLKDLTDIVGRWHLDEKAGAIAYDSSKNALDATIIGASPATGQIAGCQYFDGINDYINCGNDPLITQMMKDITLEAWVRKTATGGDTTIIGTRRNRNDFTSPYNLYIMGAGNTPRFWMGNGAALKLAQSSVNVIIGEWTHIRATIEGTAMKIWVNGIETGSGVFNGTRQTAVTLTLGASDLLMTRPYKGDIDEVVINDVAITNPLHSKRRYPA